MLFSNRIIAIRLNSFKSRGRLFRSNGVHSGKASFAFSATVASTKNGTGSVTTKSGAWWEKSILHPASLRMACR
jgi:hypothetical protein